MDIDSKCLFVDLGNCNEFKIQCRDLLKARITANDDSSLLDGRTKMENLLLGFGRFDMTPCNVEQFHVCKSHADQAPASLFKNCCLCKPFGRSKSSKSGLRLITKLYAFAAWKKNRTRITFGRKMCTQCRNHLEDVYINEELRQECITLFQWLYDLNINHTPSNSTSGSCGVLSQSLKDLFVQDKQKLLKEFLQGNTMKY